MTVTVHHHPHRRPPSNRADRIAHASRALRHFGSDDMDRATARRLLSMWTARWMLDAADREELLAEFPEEAPA